MRCTPYGYDIVDGKAVTNEESATQVRALFRHYLDGKALTKAAELVGMKLYHGSAGRMLRNKHYLGDDYYPQIIDKETFDKVEDVRLKQQILEGSENGKPMIKRKFQGRLSSELLKQNILIHLSRQNMYMD